MADAAAVYGGRAAPYLVLREQRARISGRSSRDTALLVLDARFGGVLRADPHADDGLFEFQRDGAARAHAILERYGGVLIADSVGLGKTHVAAALARAALKRGGRVSIVGPAALRRHWRAAVGPEPAWTSYARLSRSMETTGEPCDLVVFDEAHALRNPATRRYRAALQLCEGARVVLLSATPVNNSLRDLYHLLRLFAGDRHFAAVGVPSLRAAFEQAEATCLLGATPSIQPVLRAVMIRRTREQVRTSTPPGDARLRFPRQQSPRAVSYALADDDAIERLASGLVELSFPAHGGAGADTPVDLMRLGLLKRLESSAHAFHRSLTDYEALLDRCLAAHARGLHVRAREGRRSSDDGAQLCFDELVFQRIGPTTEAARYGAALERERDVVRRLRACIGGGDPKLDALVALLEGELRGAKVIVFTQFRDTARHLHDRLRGRFHAALVDGTHALLGAQPCDRSGVVRRFAPRANRAPEPPMRESVDVLVATDVLSEGFNLQDASIVISYDLPWNPVRLVQRVGRVDRLGSTHESIASYHFLPGRLERYLGLVERIARKSSAIEATTGSDVPLLHAQVARALRRGDVDVFDRIESEDAGWLRIDERLRRLLASADRLPRAPDDAVPAALVAARPDVPPDHRQPSGLVAALVGARFEWVAVVNGVAHDDERRCAELVERAITGAQVPGPVDRSGIEALLRVARPALARRAAAAAGSALLPAGGAGAALGRHLLRAAAALPGGLDPTLCARIEAALDRLARAPDAAVRRVAIPADAGLLGLLDRIERVPAPDRARPRVTGPVGDRAVRLVGVLLEAAPDR